MNWLRKFMAGRYGANDALSKALLVSFFVVWLLSLLSRNGIAQIASFLIVILMYFRLFSRNIQKRYAENMAYLRFTQPFRSWFQLKKKHLKERKTHRFFSCPSCKQKIRVPKGRGNVTITCPKCQTKFDKRT